MKSNLIDIDQQFLIMMLAQENPEVQKFAAHQLQAKMKPGNLYIKTEITGADGIKNLITSSTLEKVGTSSFDKQRLPSGVKMALSKIRLGIASVASTDTNPAAAQSYTNLLSAVEPKFRAAHLIINRAGKEIVNVPVMEFLSLDDNQGMVCDVDCYQLPAFRYLQGDELLDIQLEFPDNVAWTANKKIFVSVELLGPSAQA